MKPCSLEDSRDLELTGTCALTFKPTRIDEYQLPTQRNQAEQLQTSCKITHNSDDSIKQEQSSSRTSERAQKKFKLTNNILNLYSTPIEREIPCKRARSVERTANISVESLQFVERIERHGLQESKDVSLCGKHQPVCSSNAALQFSNNVVNEYIIKTSGSGASKTHNHGCLNEIAPDDSTVNNVRKSDLQAKSKTKMFEQIRPSHSTLAKDFDFRPAEAFKVNGMALSDRLSIQLTSPIKPSSEIKQPTWAPRHWWSYLNDKIAKKNLEDVALSDTPKNINKPKRSSKVCKVCHFDSEDSVKQTELGKDVLHIDLKRLTQVRSKDWSTYGHYTKMHKLRYTKRTNEIPKLTKEQECGIDIDEDYLNVDVDRLMNIYEQSPNGRSWNFPTNPFSNNQKRYHDSQCSILCGKSANGREINVTEDDSIPPFLNTDLDNFQYSRDCTTLQRPPTTTLRSCVNFTSRKSCFTNL